MVLTHLRRPPGRSCGPAVVGVRTPSQTSLDRVLNLPRPAFPQTDSYYLHLHHRAEAPFNILGPDSGKTGVFFSKAFVSERPNVFSVLSQEDSRPTIVCLTNARRVAWICMFRNKNLPTPAPHKHHATRSLSDLKGKSSETGMWKSRLGFFWG